MQRGMFQPPHQNRQLLLLSCSLRSQQMRLLRLSEKQPRKGEAEQPSIAQRDHRLAMLVLCSLFQAMYKPLVRNVRMRCPPYDSLECRHTNDVREILFGMNDVRFNVQSHIAAVEVNFHESILESHCDGNVNREFECVHFTYQPLF